MVSYNMSNHLLYPGNKCYKMVKSDVTAGEGLSWDEALTRCRSDANAAGGIRGGLASIQNYAEAGMTTVLLYILVVV